MTRGPLQPFSRRTLRGLAVFVASFLLAGHVLAATGLCVVTTPEAPAAVHESSAGCAEHVATEAGRGQAVKHHCPAEDPSPQARSVDLPAAQPVAAVNDVSFYRVDALSDRLPQVISGHEVPPPPLYARLQRLRL